MHAEDRFPSNSTTCCVAEGAEVAICDGCRGVAIRVSLAVMLIFGDDELCEIRAILGFWCCIISLFDRPQGKKVDSGIETGSLFFGVS